MQNTSQLLMIRPVNFGFNAQTAVNNSFQKNIEGNVQQAALIEFDRLVAVLRDNKVDVTIVEDSADPSTPDSIFPNNWISFHADGRLALYPMFAKNRRQERKSAVLETINENFIVKDTLDLSAYEQESVYLEGTGSMVLDRENKIAYACLSPRTDEMLLNKFCGIFGYEPVTFRSIDDKGAAIYHTNVMMCVAKTFAVVCLQSISDAGERKKLVDSFVKTKKEMVEISAKQMNSFAGNMLQVVNSDGEVILVMSSQAFQSLSPAQVEILEKHNRIIHSSLNTVESAGGGSARCMMAEVFLNKKNGR